MAKINAENERIKHQYFEFLKQANGRSEATIGHIERAIRKFEEAMKYVSFKSFDQKQAIQFKDKMGETELALASILSILRYVQSFFKWLALQSGYKRKIRLTDVEYFNLSDRDVRAASTPAEKKFPTLKMIVKVVNNMPTSTGLELRNRALIAFTAITGIRDGATISLKLKHFDVSMRRVRQDPKEVATKNRKLITTFLFPLDDSLEQIVLDWVSYLREEVLFADHDPLFPSTIRTLDENDCFIAGGLSKEHWSNANSIRKIFKTAFLAVDLSPFTPHLFRNMIVSEAYLRGLSVAQFKAWSQNLGHEGAMTTLTSYGTLSLHDQAELVRKSGQGSKDRPKVLEEIMAILDANKE